MVKSILILIMVMSSSLVWGEDITNINQCLNINLTAEVLCRFPSNPTSTVQNCVLTLVKGSVSGDLGIFVSPFSPEIRSSEFGISDLDNIPGLLRNEFSALMTSVTNCTSRVVSYNETTSNGAARVSMVLHRQGIGYNRAESLHLDIASTNNFWRIVNWDVDE